MWPARQIQTHIPAFPHPELTALTGGIMDGRSQACEPTTAQTAVILHTAKGLNSVMVFRRGVVCRLQS